MAVHYINWHQQTDTQSAQLSSQYGLVCWLREADVCLDQCNIIGQKDRAIRDKQCRAWKKQIPDIAFAAQSNS